jgi:hypothetical protein
MHFEVSSPCLRISHLCVAMCRQSKGEPGQLKRINSKFSSSPLDFLACRYNRICSLGKKKVYFTLNL